MADDLDVIMDDIKKWEKTGKVPKKDRRINNKQYQLILRAEGRNKK